MNKKKHISSIIKLPLFFAVCILLSSCSINAFSKANPEDYTGKTFIFGDGGGFSGIENCYSLREDGKIYQIKDRRTNYVYLDKISKKDAEQLFVTYELMGLDKLDLNNPDNTYKFIEFKDKSNTKRLVWSSSTSTSKELQILYRILKTKAQQNK